MKNEITIESLPEKAYLAIRGYMSWRDISLNEYDEWEHKYGFPDKNLIEPLKIKSGAKQVYNLFCNSCRKDEQFDWVCGDDIACENINNVQAGDGFEIIHLAPSEYLMIDYFYGSEMTDEQLPRKLMNIFGMNGLKTTLMNQK